MTITPLVRWLGLVLMLALAGCATVTPPPLARTSLAPVISPELAAALTEAASCAHPIAATHTMSRSFKYGCFCGKNYPALRHPSGKADSDLNDEERAELIAQYMRIKPIDEIDAACQAHDVCWVLNGRPDLACNRALEASLADLQVKLRAEIGRGGVSNTYQWRCVQLSRDMQMVSRFAMEGQSDDFNYTAGAVPGRVAASPAIAAYAALFSAGNFSDLYPHADERCTSKPLRD